MAGRPPDSDAYWMVRDRCRHDGCGHPGPCEMVASGRSWIHRGRRRTGRVALVCLRAGAAGWDPINECAVVAEVCLAAGPARGTSFGESPSKAAFETLGAAVYE